MMRLAMAAILALTLVGCGAAAGRIAPDVLGVSARDAYTEARSVARVWSTDARLRWVEGEGINPAGIALPDGGSWRFHFTAPGKVRALSIRVRALEETGSEERPFASPPGYVIGDNALSTTWVDSRIVMAAVAAAEGSVPAPVSMLLVPTRPEQWIVRAGEAGERWRVDAATGEVVRP